MKHMIILTVLCFLLINCSTKTIEGNFWCCNKDMGYLEFSFNKEFIHVFNGESGIPLEVKYSRDSIMFGYDISKKSSLNIYKVNKLNRGNTMLFVNNSDTLEFNKIKTKGLFIGNVQEEQMEELINAYYLRNMENLCN